MAIQIPCLQCPPAVGTDPGQVSRFAGSGSDMGSQAVEPIAQELPDTAEPQYQAIHAQQRPVQPLHGHLDRSLRCGGGIGHSQLFPEEVVLQAQSPILRLPPLLGLHLSRQQ